MLPEPQEVRYGKGSLRLQGLSIRLASDDNAEDRFAAEQLAATLKSRSRISIPTTDKAVAGRAIVLTRTGSGPALPQPDEHAGPDSREAYTLSITPQGGEIRARSSTGLFYGVQTLREMVEGTGREAALPEAEVHDWPLYAYRAVMMDMSEGGLPTEKEVQRQLDFLARWKANQYFLYSEGSIELQGYSLMNPGDARFSQEQVRRIITYARQRHIDVIPCVELYGHMHALFRIERYSDLAVVPHGRDFDPRNPRGKVVVEAWVEQLSQLFPSPFFHIGFDETYDMEMAGQAHNVDPGQLYLEQLKSVAALVQQHGKRVMIWGDHNIVTKYPEILPSLPPGLIAVPWHNGLQASYDEYLAPFAARGIPQYASTSIYGYSQVFPDFSQSLAALTNLMVAARQNHSVGLLVTLWTDAVQVLTRAFLPGVAFGMCLSWQSTALSPDKFFAEYAGLLYPPSVAREVAAALKALADAETRLQKVVGFNSMQAFWSDPLSHASFERTQGHQEDFRQVRLLAEDGEEHVLRALDLGGDAETLKDFLLESQMLDYAGMKFLYAIDMTSDWQKRGAHAAPRQGESLYDGMPDIDDLLEAAARLHDSFQAAWLSEYTPSRLREGLDKWDAEYQYWYRLQRRLADFLRNLQEGETLPPLTSFSPDVKPQ